MLIIPVTQEAQVGGSLSKANPGKASMRPSLHNNMKAKGLGVA
jgi:hypothetical protein